MALIDKQVCPRCLSLCRDVFSVQILLAIFFVLTSAQELTSSLHSTFYGLKFAYDHETVTFFCETRGSSSIGWSSDEYIGSGGNRLEFVSIEPNGTTQTAGQTVATLVNVSSIRGLTFLTSMLQISVQSVFQISSVACHNLGSDTVRTISFGAADNTTITCDKLSACPGETVTCICTTGYSNTLAWSSDKLIGQNDARLEFVSIESVGTRRNVTGSSTFAVLTGVFNPNGVVVLSSNLTFVASDNPANILTCLNVGHQSSYSVIVPLSKNCPTIPTFTSTDTMATDSRTNHTTNPGVTGSGTSDIDVIISVVFLLATIIILVIPVIVIIIYILLRKKKTTKACTNGEGNETHSSETPFSLHHDSTKRSEELSLEQQTEVTGDCGDETESVEQMNQVQEVATNANNLKMAELDQEITNTISMAGKRGSMTEDDQPKSACMVGVAMSSRSHKSSIPEQLLSCQSTSEDRASTLQSIQSSAEPSGGHENEITDIDPTAIMVAIQSQKEMLQEAQTGRQKVKTLHSLLDEVYENTRNNSGDVSNYDGSKERAQAKMGAKEEEEKL